MIEYIRSRLRKVIVSFIIREIEVLRISEGETVVVYTELEEADRELLERIYHSFRGNHIERVIICSRDIRKIESFEDLVEEEGVFSL